MIFNAIVTQVERLSSDNKSEYEAVGGMPLVNCSLVPVSDRDVLLFDGARIGHTYTLHTSSSGFNDTDRLTISGKLNKFKVQGITDYSITGIIQHWKLILFEAE